MGQLIRANHELIIVFINRYMDVDLQSGDDLKTSTERVCQDPYEIWIVTQPYQTPMDDVKGLLTYSCNMIFINTIHEILHKCMFHLIQFNYQHHVLQLQR